LKAKDPWLVESYIHLTKQAFKKEKLFRRLSSLSDSIHREGLLPVHEQEFNSIQQLQTLLRTEIEQGLR
jgi:hypothetical protein